MIGKTLSSYTIVDTLGSGGMGTVYLARDTRLGRTVALKVLPPEVARDPDRSRRFLLEARSASALKHPNVAHIYDVGDADGVRFIVMEHIEGETLHQRLAQGPLAVADAVAVASQIADALADAHERRIVHRDIKPANVMLTARGTVKVLDFGLARFDQDLTVNTNEATMAASPALSSETTQAGRLLGTVPYMSPEQARGDRVDARTDVFSLGVVLYEMLAGRRPFQGRTPKETLERILRGNPEDVAAVNPAVPPALAAVVRRCLAADPGQRYPAAKDLLADLAAAAPGASAAPAVPAPASAPREDDLSKIESIAVMPFENGSKEEAAEYLCDGLAESLIATLSRLPDLRVISRTATFALRDEPKDIRALGERLGVDALVLGDLRPRGDRVVVNVELVGVPDGRRLWGDRYDRPLTEVAAVEQDMVDNVSKQLKEALSSDEVARLVGREVDPQAYLLYLKGRSLIIGSATQMEKGAEYLEEAARRDPNYALPHAALVESYMARCYHNVIDLPEARQKARAAARTAVKLDPNLPEAHTALGIVRFMFDWDWEGADEAFRKAIEMGGGDVPHLEYAEFLAGVGRLSEALPMAARARELDPVSPQPTHSAAYTMMLMGKHAEAADAFRTAISLHPDWIWGHIKLAVCLSHLGAFEEALAEAGIAEAALHGGGTPLARSWIGRVYGAAGERDTALAYLAKLQDTDTVQVDPLTRSYIHSVLGERDRFLDCVEEAYRKRSALVCMIHAVGRLEAHLDLETEPRFQAVVDRMGFPDWGGKEDAVQ
jgi:serine/threonine protein kinase/Tfp pilus assembly protein PilF